MPNRHKKKGKRLSAARLWRALATWLILSLALAACSLVGGNGSESGGSGHDDEESPNTDGYAIGSDGAWHVYTAEGLKAWAEAAKEDPGTSCTLHSCISLAGVDWTPIGAGGSTDPDLAYAGTFDGGGHEISNLSIISGDDSYIGFFSVVGDEDGNGAVLDLGLADVDIEGLRCVGAIAGGNYGTISGCYSTGNVRATNASASANSGAGGIVGDNAGGTIAGCHSSSAVAGLQLIGGIAGTSYGDIAACYYTGNVSGTTGVGGVAGRYEGGSIAGCYFKGGIAADSDGGAHGIVGMTSAGIAAADIAACYWESDGADYGAGNGTDAGAAEAGEGGVAWTDAQDAMNEAIGGSGWTYYGATESEPPLLKKSL